MGIWALKDDSKIKIGNMIMSIACGSRSVMISTPSVMRPHTSKEPIKIPQAMSRGVYGKPNLFRL